VIFVIGNAIEMKWFEIGVFWCHEIEFSWERSNKIKM